MATSARANAPMIGTIMRQKLHGVKLPVETRNIAQLVRGKSAQIHQSKLNIPSLFNAIW